MALFFVCFSLKPAHVQGVGPKIKPLVFSIPADDMTIIKKWPGTIVTFVKGIPLLVSVWKIALPLVLGDFIFVSFLSRQLLWALQPLLGSTVWRTHFSQGLRPTSLFCAEIYCRLVNNTTLISPVWEMTCKRCWRDVLETTQGTRVYVLLTRLMTIEHSHRSRRVVGVHVITRDQDNGARLVQAEGRGHAS